MSWVDIICHQCENWEWGFWIFSYKHIVLGGVFCGKAKCIDKLIGNFWRWSPPPPSLLKSARFCGTGVCFGATFLGSGWQFERGRWGTAQYCRAVTQDVRDWGSPSCSAVGGTEPGTWSSPIAVLSCVTSPCWYRASRFLRKSNTSFWQGPEYEWILLWSLIFGLCNPTYFKIKDYLAVIASNSS